MRLVFTALAIPALLTACTGEDQYGVNGQPMNEYFPFDGSSRTWSFVSTDVELPYKMVGTLDPAYVETDDARVYTIDYVTRCVMEEVPCEDDVLLQSLSVSADRTNGVRLHAFDTGAGPVALAPPVKLANGSALAGEEVKTESGGSTWTSTFTALVACEILWTPDWNECAHIQLDDGGANSGMSGEIWAVVNYNMVAFQLQGDTGRWELERATWEE